MNWKRLWAKLPFENRLIRFLVFDLLLGFELSGMEMGEELAMANGTLALYLLLTSIVGRDPIQQAVILVLQERGIIKEEL